MRRISPKQTLRRQGAARGFTLVELMIAMVIVGALTSIIYGLFVRTSDALTEVDALAQTLDRARFGLLHVRNDLQGAGSQATPNGETDPWVQPKLGDHNLHALRVYSGWKADEEDEPDWEDVPEDLISANPGSRFSGFIVVGAYDFPQSFLVRGVQGSESGATMVIEDNERGIGRLLRVDPFDLESRSELELDESEHANLIDNIDARLLRVMDGEGFFQFATIDEDGLDPQLRTLAVSGVHFRQEGQFSGLDPALVDDVSVDVALLDAFWYEVKPQEGNPTNFQLLRHRIRAGILRDGAALDKTTLENAIVSTLVIADNVVDFRVWFDCAGAGGLVTAVPRETTWNISDPGGGCLSVTDPSPELARAAHIRLSLRTPRENPNRPHLDLNISGVPAGFEAAGGPMITYDLHPDAKGSASVVTVQTSVELTGLAMRGVL